MPTLVQVLSRALAQRGVRFAFGMPGGDVLPLVEALHAEGIADVLVRHEGSAGFAAEAAHVRTGAPGLAYSTLGPGATNLLSGAAAAQLERSRALFITGQCPSAQLGRYTHQIIDQCAIFAPVCKESIALRPEALQQRLEGAMEALDSGLPGAVHLDLPAELCAAPARWLAEARSSRPPGVDGAGVAELERLLHGARRPGLVVGHLDLSEDTAASLTRLSARLGAPVWTTYRAKGMVPEGEGGSAGAIGLSPVVDRLQRRLMEEADLIVAVGLDWTELRAEWLGWPAQPWVRLEPRPRPEPALTRPPELELWGDLAPALGALAEGPPRAPWADLGAHRAGLARPFADGDRGPASALAAVRRAAGAEVCAALDVGAHRITAAHVWDCAAPRRLLQSNGLSSMGVGLPMGISAALHQGGPAVVITGDMGLWMCVGELGLAAELGLHLVVVVLRDDSLALIELKQERMGLPPRAVRFRGPEGRALAEAMGGRGCSVRGAEQLEREVRRALAEPGLHLIVAEIDAAMYRTQM